MPIINSASYTPPRFLKNRHFNTIYPHFFRKNKDVVFERERIITSDGDFLDVDWVKNESSKLAIVLHGLEGSSGSSYIGGVASALSAQGWDVVVMNFRGCSGEDNLLLRSYHTGGTEDLQFLISHILEKKNYGRLVLAGFSLGGNVVLKFVAEESEKLPKEIKAALAFSVPCDLAGAEKAIGNIYTKMFLNSLIPKAIGKIEKHKACLDKDRIRKAKTIWEFDDAFTAPVHGFEGADDYYQRSSSLFQLHKINIPTLLLSAMDDPFLSKSCFPFQIAEKHRYLHFTAPKFGGHVGFVQFNKTGLYWSEQQALGFFAEKVDLPC